ncbi:hypothetical protein [Caulobacter sp. S45]|uniref:hypothetical protein n=1 Tax=Caulobacter sp. S45 TaxID=1641861 RepID=UPI00131B066F|nr:hypothetical protein [Caulobacter sp. S45]
MTITFPTPAFDTHPLLLARRAARRVKWAVFQYRNAANIRLLSQFESLGDNCEFASLQKGFGVDLPGMFKWTETSVRMLTDTLGDNLAGGDDIANLKLETNTHDGEYLLHHRLYKANSHTFARIALDDPDKVLQREHRRLILLKRKFLEDVQAGRRIYVFRSLRPVSEDQAADLHRALRRKGPNTLLWIRAAREPGHVGRVERRADGLMVAEIDTLATYEDGMTYTSRHWLPILRKARALAHDVRVSSGMAA